MKSWLLGAVALCSVAVPAHADGLVENVAGVALNEKGEVVRFSAIQVDADGKVVKLLNRRDKRPERPDWLSDMKGRVVIPGMIDAHGHVMELGFRALQLDLSNTRSLSEAATAIAGYARANGNRPWILGGGWNHEAWGLGRFPTASDLDVAVADKPVLLQRADGHAVWANRAAMRAAGITARTKAPEGGRIEKLANVDDWLTFRRMGDDNLLRVRIMSYAAGVQPALQVAGSAPTPWLYGDRLRMGGVKLYTDGALGSRGAWLKAPYADAPTQTGLGFQSDDKLLNLMSRAAMDGFQLAIHAIGDRANQQVLDAIEEMAVTYKGDRRWRIEHAQVIDPADLARFGRNGIVASMQPVHQTSDRAMAEVRLGESRLAGAYAWRTVMNSGAKLAFGSDYPVEDPNPFVGWAAAFTRTDPAGQPPGGWRPQEAVSREQAWRAFTIDAAYAGFAEKRFGALAKGMRADFIVVDRDPTEATPEALRQTQVLETWVGGRQAWKRK